MIPLAKPFECQRSLEAYKRMETKMEQSTKLGDARNKYDLEFWTCPKLNESRNSSQYKPAPPASVHP